MGFRVSGFRIKGSWFKVFLEYPMYLLNKDMTLKELVHLPVLKYLGYSRLFGVEVPGALCLRGCTAAPQRGRLNSRTRRLTWAL